MCTILNREENSLENYLLYIKIKLNLVFQKSKIKYKYGLTKIYIQGI